MGRLKGLAHDERGVSAVVAAVALLGIFAAATLSVDAGNVWQSRRNIITATDAAALAEAGDLALSGSSSCTGLYSTVLTRNAGADVIDRTCAVETHPTKRGWGYVVVEGRKPVSVRFGGVLGLDDTSAYSLSAAQFGAASSARGLRPIGVCSEDQHVRAWRAFKAGTLSQSDYNALKGAGDVDGDLRIDYPIASTPGRPTGRTYGSFGVVHRVYFTKSAGDACGDTPGNWGWLNFDGGSGDQTEIARWLREGYNGGVAIRPSTVPDCVAPPGQGTAGDSEQGCVPSSSGSVGGSVDAALASILDKPIAIMVYDASDCVGGGSNCRFDSFAFVGVILRGYKVTGAEESRFFDWEFTNIQLSGRCCDVEPGRDLGARAIELCAVDHDSKDITSLDRCGGSV